MSLVGSLEDLSLGDILQIISLSQKSGVLSLQTKGNGGRIVFVGGLVRGAALDDGASDLRGVLTGGGFLTELQIDAALEHAATSGCNLAAAVVATTALSGERIDSLCREAVESAVVTMFSWTTGEFSFDVQSEFDSEGPELLLPTGINAEYLAMEGARLRDEFDRGAGGEPVASRGAEQAAEPADPRGFDDMPAHEMFGVAPEVDPEAQAGAGPSEAADADSGEDADEVLLEAEPIEDEAVLDLAEGDVIDDSISPEIAADELLDAQRESSEQAPIPVAGAEADDRVGAAETRDASGAAQAEPLAGDAAEPEHRSEATSPAAADGGPLVAMDGDLLALEWVKNAVRSQYSPVHIFQQTDQGLARIRQYLVRGEPPVVLISPTMKVDSLGGIASTADFIARLKSQSPRLRAFWLREDGVGPSPAPAPADGVVTRPDGNQLRFDRKASSIQELAHDLLERLCSDSGVRGDPAPEADGSGRGALGEGHDHISPDTLVRLRDATKALTEASTRGEVLPLVICFASEVFSRVAMFMVRDGMALGIAQHGLDRCGGPGDAKLRDVCFETASSAWMSSVLEQRRAVEGSPSDDGDFNLVRLLGDRIPASAYVGPIESSGQVIALLYGDNLPGDEPVPDTSALEVVLHHAGLALERAVLERALREADADPGDSGPA